MSSNTNKIKNFFLSPFKGRKKSGACAEKNAHWEGVAEEDTSRIFYEPCLATTFADRSLFVSNVHAATCSGAYDPHTTRASVYVRDRDVDRSRSSRESPSFSDHLKVSRNLSQMDSGDIATVTFFDSETSLEDLDPETRREALAFGKEVFDDDEKRFVKEDSGPGVWRSDSTPTRCGMNELRSFPLEAEQASARSNCFEESYLESVNSLNIDAELSELMGALRAESERADGSKINLAFLHTEPEEPAATDRQNAVINYDILPRVRSRSFVGEHRSKKLSRKGRERMSAMELGRNRKKANAEAGDDELSTREDVVLFRKEKEKRFGRGALERCSFAEPRASSAASLPSRPHSALENGRRSDSSESAPVARFDSAFQRRETTSTSRDSYSIGNSASSKDGFEESIDWSWLEEAVKAINSEPCVSSSLRVDAECQTQPEQRWESQEISSSNSCPRQSSPGSEIDESERVSERDDGGGGGSEVGAWSRRSMRRLRRFDLGDPPRIRSAPPIAARSEIEAASFSPAVLRNDGVSHSASRPVSAPVEGDASRRRAESATSASEPPAQSEDDAAYESDSTDRHPSPLRRRGGNSEGENEDGGVRSPLGPWPRGPSSVFAGLGCTLGLFNVSRFAVLSVRFGAGFVVQFLLLSFALGVPLLAFHAALGQSLGAGPVDMWKISPVFQGVGIALLLGQALVGTYSIVGVSWMFVYFRDSFVNKQDSFRWAESFRHYREENIFATSILNTSGKLEETVPDYLNGVVLQRYGLAAPHNGFGHLKFQLTFNLAVVWMIVFVSLSKGLRSYGKVVYVFSVVPILGILIVSSKLMSLAPFHRGLFPQTEWSEFFVNGKSWISAATEVALTWNLLGAATMQVTSHNPRGKKLWRDVAAIAFLTLFVLILAAFLGNACYQFVSLAGYHYMPSSFERISTYSFLRPTSSPLPPAYAVPVRHMGHASLIAGERVKKPGVIHESGYQVVRLATELVPATLAILHGNSLSPFWAVLFYFTVILFGIGQQLAIWHCVITGIVAIDAPSLKSWETTITFFTCAAGFVLGLPMTTELGIFVVYFLDYCLGGGWWLALVTLVELCAVLMVRGRPYSGESICTALFGKVENRVSVWAVPLLTFSWNVLVPVSLLTISVAVFKSGGYRDLWIWKCGNADYWPLWTREVGVFVQLIPLLCIPAVALVQCYRYLSKGPPDIFDRLANLYRPTGNVTENGSDVRSTPNAESNSGDGTGNGVANGSPSEDPPPKYTPPPSYSTATGSRLGKFLRQSLRRSVRRIQSALGPDPTSHVRVPPPDYASVLVEMNEDVRAGHPNTFTAADVVQVLRCSFRRSGEQASTTSAATSVANGNNLVISSSRWPS